MCTMQASSSACSSSPLLLRRLKQKPNTIWLTWKAKLEALHRRCYKTDWFTHASRFAIKGKGINWWNIVSIAEIKQSRLKRPSNHSIYDYADLKQSGFEVEFTVHVTRASPFKLFFKWGRVCPVDDRSLRQTLHSRRPNIQTRHFSFHKFNPVILLRHILLIQGPNHGGDSLREWRKGAREGGAESEQN